MEQLNVEKHNPSSSPDHRPEAVDRSTFEDHLSFSAHDLSPYINWIYFFHAWGSQPRYAAITNIHGCNACRASQLTTFPEGERGKASKAMQLYKETNRMLDRLDEDSGVKNVFKLYPANADGDNLIIDGVTFPLFRQQAEKKGNEPFLRLSDLVRPLTSGITDIVRVFAPSIDTDVEGLYKQDPYKHLLVQILSDRLVEAAIEKMHEYVRKKVWGYVKDENLSIPDLLVEKYQDIRPTVGYPSLPGQSINFILDEILDMGQIGIRLTESGAVHPRASVCRLMFAYPTSHYFSMRKVGKDRLADYTARRGKSIGEMRKFLAANLQ